MDTKDKPEKQLAEAPKREIYQGSKLKKLRKVESALPGRIIGAEWELDNTLYQGAVQQNQRFRISPLSPIFLPDGYPAKLLSNQ